MNKYHNWINTGLIAIVLILVLIGGNQSGQFGATGTRFPNGISADSTSPSSGEVRGSTLTITGAQALTGATTLGGLLTTNAGSLRSYTNATTSVGTGTLKQSDVDGYDTVLLTPTGAAATKTLTFFASSTASTWIPTAGDMQETCFYNSTTTAATTITFAAGVGIDLEMASTTGIGGVPDLILSAGATACFKFIRQPTTASTFDISALMMEYGDAD